MTTLNDIEFDAAWSSSEVKMLLGGVRSDSERRALKGELFWRRAEMGADIAVARAAADELNARAFALRREIRAEAHRPPRPAVHGARACATKVAR